MKVLGVIPARLDSTRLPRKVLREVAGEPLLLWVYRAAKACGSLSDVVVAVDSDEVAALCRKRGMPFVMTAPELPSGTDRLFAVSREHDADIYVNIQGDEPLLTPAHIDALLAPFARPHVEVATL
ncbi:MAG: NTP transferase domain-containing protein, partial [Bryocella sp.]